MLRMIGLLTLVALCLVASSPAAAEPVRADILLKGGTIYDGTGGPGRVGDVAIRGERVVAVGTFETGRADLVLDCTGMIVCPGFIDLHSHSDRGITDPKTRGNVNFLMQGCTTVVTGNCGSGPVDVGAYFKKIDAAGAGTNVAHLLPQGSLRLQIISTVQRKATADELNEMRQLVARAMQDGACGISTGLIYVPSSYADTEELVELAKVVGEHGGFYASHIRGEGLELLASVDEALEIGRRAKLPVHVSHFKASGEEAWGLVRRAAEAIEKARAGGQKVTADQYPYTASSTSLEATLIPTWARAGGNKALVSRIDTSADGKRIREEISRKLELKDGGATIRIARFAPRPEWTGKSLAEIADATGKPALDVVLDITRSGGAQIVNFGMSEEDVRFVMQLPWVATASDGSAMLPNADRPHPRSYGTFPRKIGHYSLDQDVLPVTQAIHSASGLPAQILGLTDRGLLEAERFADVVVFDSKTFRDTATFEAPHRYAVGAKYVFVNGKPAVFEGTATGALAGRALKFGPAGAKTEAGGAQ